MVHDFLIPIIFSTKIKIRYFNEIFKLLLLYHLDLKCSYSEYDEGYLYRHFFKTMQNLIVINLHRHTS